MGRIQNGFTLLEILLIVAAIAILAGAVVIAVNPLRQLREARDSVRRGDVSAIWNATAQYALDNHGALPGSVPAGTLEDCLANATSTEFGICRTSGCEVVLDDLLDNGYLVEVPADPTAATDDYSGYTIVADTEHAGRATVCAPAAEGGSPIYLPK